MSSAIRHFLSRRPLIQESLMMSSEKHDTQKPSVVRMCNFPIKGGKEELGLGSSLGMFSLQKNFRAQASIEEEGRAPEYENEYVASEAGSRDEYWASAWLRAEGFFEENEIVGSSRRMFAERSFISLERRCNSKEGKECKCIIMVKKEDKKLKNTLQDRIVGTLDLQLQYSSGHAAVVPYSELQMERGATYAFISILYVARSARRQGVATTMLQHAISIAKKQGIEKVFLRVDEYNEGALILYKKMGFKVVAGDEVLLMCYEET